MYMINHWLYIGIMNKIINWIIFSFRVKIQQRELYSCTWQNKKKIKHCYRYLWLWLQLSKRYRKQKLKLRNQMTFLIYFFFTTRIIFLYYNGVMQKLRPLLFFIVCTTLYILNSHLLELRERFKSYISDLANKTKN